MTCETFEDFILDDLDRRLAPEHRAALSNHLAICPACRAFLSAQAALDQALARSARPELPPAFAARVLLRTSQSSRTIARLPHELLWNCAGVLTVAVAGAVATQQLVPHLVPGLAWAIAALVVSAGAVVVTASAAAYSD